MRKAQFGDGYGRGVWVAPWMGPDGELILVARKRDNREACPPVYVQPGQNSVEIADSLWDVLDLKDPEVRAILKAI
jgi:hypothetical protein